MMSALVDSLRTIVGPTGLLLGDEVQTRNARPQQARVLVRPANTTEVSKVLAACQAAGVAVVPQGGMTGLVHGADAQAHEVILSLERMQLRARPTRERHVRTAHRSGISRSLAPPGRRGTQGSAPAHRIQNIHASSGSTTRISLRSLGTCRPRRGPRIRSRTRFAVAYTDLGDRHWASPCLFGVDQ